MKQSESFCMWEKKELWKREIEDAQRKWEEASKWYFHVLYQLPNKWRLTADDDNVS